MRKRSLGPITHFFFKLKDIVTGLDYWEYLNAGVTHVDQFLAPGTYNYFLMDAKHCVTKVSATVYSTPYGISLGEGKRGIR